MLTKRLLYALVLSIVLLGFGTAGMASVPKDKAQSLTDRVRHQLVMLPYYSVFDELAFNVEGNTVVLMGEVRRPTLKSDAEATVRRVEGVEKVVNNIEVLPVSPMDDSIRLAAYRAIFSKPGFEQYADQPVSPIRIVVKNGNITLDGAVGTGMDKPLAELAARAVPYAFSVKPAAKSALDCQLVHNGSRDSLYQQQQTPTLLVRSSQSAV